MIAVDNDRPAAREFDRLSERVLTIAGVYGPNASGKSNVLDALAWLSAAVEVSLRTWREFIPREPHRFGDGEEAPSTFEIEMIVQGVRYVYRLEADEFEVHFEGLYSYPERRRRVLFEREGLDIGFRRGLGGLAGTRELLTPTTLALSAAMRFGEPEVQPFGRRLAGIGTLGLRGLASWRRQAELDRRPASSTERLFGLREHYDQPDPPGNAQASPADRDSALALLRFADLGIDDVQLVHDEDGRPPSGSTREGRRRLRFLHRAGGEELPFDLAEESAGTQTWFRLIGPALDALGRGQVLIFDEIDASLHPRLSARLLELFQDPQTNPLGAQLIFSTHDTSLLNSMNRDEVWLTEKNEDGSTTLTALAEYGGDKVRRSLNLEKAYLQGRFGAVPDLDQFMLRRALGLALGEP